MAHLDAPGETQVGSAAGTGVLFPDHPEIGELAEFEIPVPVDIFHVVILPVGSHDKIGHIDKGVIRDDPGFDADGTGESPG
jgi:hypothetical protein